MTTKTVDELMQDLERSERDLTLSMMRRAIAHVKLIDPELFWDVYETVVHFTGDFPEDEGWGTSDTSAVLRAVSERIDAVKAYQQQTPA